MTNKEVLTGDASGAKWRVIYPQYINSNLTIYMGRRLAKDECVVDPKCSEIKDVLESVGCFQVTVEANKCYSRELDKEVPTNRGLVKYCLVRNKQTQETIAANGFEHKKQILKYLSKTIPKLKSRSKANASQSAQTQQNVNQNNPKKKKNKK